MPLALQCKFVLFPVGREATAEFWVGVGPVRFIQKKIIGRLSLFPTLWVNFIIFAMNTALFALSTLLSHEVQYDEEYLKKLLRKRLGCQRRI